MTQSDLIARLAARYPQLVAKDADFAVKTILDAMAESLARGQRIEIRGFGIFGLNYRPPMWVPTSSAKSKLVSPKTIPATPPSSPTWWATTSVTVPVWLPMFLKASKSPLSPP
jgi:integration host factor subunit beta